MSRRQRYTSPDAPHSVRHTPNPERAEKAALIRRSNAAGSHELHGKARNRDERRKENRKIKNGDWS